MTNLTKTKWFTHDYDAKDDPKIMQLIDELGLEGYGIFWVLVETLRAAEPHYKYKLNLLGGLARKYNTTAQKMEVVVRNYGLFKIEDNKVFLSKSLLNRMLKYEEKKEQARIAAKIGAEKRRKKQEEQLKKLSGLNSSQRPLSDRLAIREDKIRIEKIKDNLSLFKDKDRESLNFKNFKEYVSSIHNFKFSLSGKLGYIKEHKGFCIKNGCIFSLHAQNFITKEEAFKIWEYLYLNKDKVLNLIKEQKERIQDAS